MEERLVDEAAEGLVDEVVRGGDCVEEEDLRLQD